jgi:hypothetical protein
VHTSAPVELRTSPKPTPSCVYRLNPDVAIEDFDGRALVLHCVDLRLIELNATATDLFHRLDGRANLLQIAEVMARDYHQPLDAILEDAQATITRMTELGIVERLDPLLE